jgi:signal transduction histidine kinase
MASDPIARTLPDHDDLRLAALGLMTAGIVHDVGNIIQVLSSTVRIVQRHPTIHATPALRPVIADASAALDGASDLIRQIGGFARGVDEGSQEVDIAHCLTGLERLLRWMVHTPVSISVDVSGNVLPVRCHRRNFENAILNLVMNARDAMPTGGVISIAAAMSQASGTAPDIFITVSDNGSGMPPEVMAKAFDPFFTTKGGRRGNGLGLAMVRRFAQLAGGSVALQSRLGEGTQVTLRLPTFPVARKSI